MEFHIPRQIAYFIKYISIPQNEGIFKGLNLFQQFEIASSTFICVFLFQHLYVLTWHQSVDHYTSWDSRGRWVFGLIKQRDQVLFDWHKKSIFFNRTLPRPFLRRPGANLPPTLQVCHWATSRFRKRKGKKNRVARFTFGTVFSPLQIAQHEGL